MKIQETELKDAFIIEPVFATSSAYFKYKMFIFLLSYFVFIHYNINIAQCKPKQKNSFLTK